MLDNANGNDLDVNSCEKKKREKKKRLLKVVGNAHRHRVHRSVEPDRLLPLHDPLDSTIKEEERAKD